VKVLRQRDGFPGAAGHVRVASERAAVAGFRVLAQAREEVVPAARAHLDAVQLRSQAVVAEMEFRRAVIDRGDGEDRTRSRPVGEKAALGYGPSHRCGPRCLGDVDHEWFG
jgi:hypothetical protein